MKLKNVAFLLLCVFITGQRYVASFKPRVLMSNIDFLFPGGAMTLDKPHKVKGQRLVSGLLVSRLVFHQHTLRHLYVPLAIFSVSK